MKKYDQHYPFTLPALPYEYEALEPYLDSATLHYHHDKHLATYLANLNKILEANPELQKYSLVELLVNIDSIKPEVKTGLKNNAGGVFNHIMYFDLLSPVIEEVPAKLVEAFGSKEALLEKIKKVALGTFGSGFAWLVKKDGVYDVISLPNQDNPLSLGYTPLLPVDVWEHAYYLGYQNKRGDYLDNLFKIINWKEVAKNI